MKLKLITALLILFNWSVALSGPLSAEDVKWLNRLTYGINSQTLASYQKQGRKQYLDAQLTERADDKLPADVDAMITNLVIEQKPAEMIVQDLKREERRIHRMPVETKPKAQKARNRYMNSLINESIQRHLLRALYSPAQVKEQMTWFWLNHFSVFRGKGAVRYLLADYEESAIRPHVLGKFRDLLMATVRHPAMLFYLDNSHNAVGKINENYARELMELHTLGIDGGYSQQDVQELARILTGAGVSWANKPIKNLDKKLERYYLRDGNFVFNPKRHDFGEKQFLGKKIAGDGFGEIEQVVDMLARHPSTARFISHKLAVYFVSDTPPPALVERMAKTFQGSDGDIAATLHTLFESEEFTASLGKKISDPMHYIVAALRFAYDGQSITKLNPAIEWLDKLSEPLYGHLTPDGYGMTEKDWISSGQLTKRFEIARQIVDSNLAADKSAALTTRKLADKPLYQAIEPVLSAQTKAALAKAASAGEWNAFMLSAPEFIYR